MSSESVKVVDLINKKDFSFSFEVSPGVDLSDIDKLEVEPTYFSVTWHAKSHQCKSLDIAPLQLAKDIKARGKEVVLHLSCDLLKKGYLDSLLKMLQNAGIRNLLVVLGERYDENLSEFKSTHELIRYIRETTLEYFCIGVAGFTSDAEEKIHHLKEKVKTGADFILTQAIFSVDHYKKFVTKCRKLDINVPIIVGLYVFETCDQLISFCNMCKVDATDLTDKIKNYSSSEIFAVLKTLVNELRNVNIKNTYVHIFTLNQLNRASNFIKEIK